MLRAKYAARPWIDAASPAKDAATKTVFFANFKLIGVMIMDFHIMITDHEFYDHIYIYFNVIKDFMINENIHDHVLHDRIHHSNFCEIAPGNWIKESMPRNSAGLTVLLGWKISSFQESSIALTPYSRSECSPSHSIRPRHHQSLSHWIARATFSRCQPVAISHEVMMESWRFFRFYQ